MTLKAIPKTTDTWEDSLSLAKWLNGRYGMACFPATGAPKPDDPASPQKMPRVGAWQKNAAATPEALDALWGTVRNQGGCYLVGTVCNGLIVIDVDTPDGHAAAVDARPQWEAWQNEYGRTSTLTVRTQSGGLHIYYRLPAGCTVPVRSGSSKLAPGIDHKTTGGYTVAPWNTFTINGEVRQYQVLEEGPAETHFIADAPAWLIEKFAALYGDGSTASPLASAAQNQAAGQTFQDKVQAFQNLAASAPSPAPAPAASATAAAMSVPAAAQAAPAPGAPCGSAILGTAAGCQEVEMASAAVEDEERERRRREHPELFRDFGVDMSDAAEWADDPDYVDIALDKVREWGDGQAPLNLRTELYIKRTLAGVCREIAAAAPGTRNHTLNGKAMWVMRLWLWGTRNNGAKIELGFLVQELADAAEQAGLPRQEANATITSAMKGAERYGEPDKIREMRQQELDKYGPLSPATVTASVQDAPAAQVQVQAQAAPAAAAPAPSAPAPKTAAPVQNQVQAAGTGTPSAPAAQSAPAAPAQAPVQNQAAPAARKPAPKPAGPRVFTEYYEAAYDLINIDLEEDENGEYGTRALEYLKSRGISEDTMDNFELGYDPYADPLNAPGQWREKKPADADKNHACPRLIIPVSRTFYVARSIDPATPEKYVELTPKGAKPGIFNVQALKQDGGTIFVTDAVLSALTYIEAGASAVSTCGALANVGELVKLISQQQCTATFILAFTNNDAGRQAKNALAAELRRRSIPFLIAPVSIVGRGATADGLNEDANELFVLDRDAFLAALKRVQNQAGARPDNMLNYLSTRIQDDRAKYRGSIQTGFQNLDGMSYGLFPGLYVIGAISSLGKTTFAWQICDNVAAAGHHVLFFSLEMSYLELASKSITRRAHLIDVTTDLTALKVRKDPWTDLAAQAAAEYGREVEERISVIEGNFDTDITSISETVRRYMRMNQDARPVVVIDYLQILKPAEDERLTDKQKVDASMTALKRLSRDLGVTVIVISSLNRTNYMTPIDFDAFKESGGIEYTADVIWGLQLMCLESEVFHSKEDVSRKKEIIQTEKKKNPRYIELVCLKNRYGISNFKTFFAYNSAAELFEELSTEEGERLIKSLDVKDGAEVEDEGDPDYCSVDLSRVPAWKEYAGRKKGKGKKKQPLPKGGFMRELPDADEYDTGGYF